jgi:hypothetical protein
MLGRGSYQYGAIAQGDIEQLKGQAGAGAGAGAGGGECDGGSSLYAGYGQ